MSNKTIFIDDLKNVLLILTFFSLWLSTRLNMNVQDYLAYSFILTFGVLHGSNDINLLTKLPLKRQKSKVLLLRYIAAVLAVLAVFLISKLAALFFFLLISGYHFGEQHLKDKFEGPAWYAIPFFLTYGLTILFLIFYLKVDEVIPIFVDITGTLFYESFFEFGLYGLFAALTLFLVYAYVNGFLKINLILEVFLFMVFFIVFKTASLIWAFCIYFIVWHSLPSLYDQMIFLYGNASKSSILKYLKSSFPYWLVSLTGLGLLYLLIGQRTDYFITVVLYVLAAITFPHVLVMSRMEHTKNVP